MTTIFTKAIKMALCGILPFLFISHSGIDTKRLNGDLARGNYELWFNGALDQQLHGQIRYQIEYKTSQENQRFSVLKFHLQDDSANPHSMEFLICLKEFDENSFEGSFQAAKNIEGFSDYFDGVYGVVDGGIFGERPFFAEKGRLKIFDSTDNSLSGEINMVVNDFHGKEIEFRGNFVALR